MGTPLVSIIIPCHNAAPWLEQSLECACNQTWPHKEIIAVDDGSTDGSAEILKRHEKRGIRVFSGPHRNAAAARNIGLAQAGGEWIQFLDADDLLAPDKIQRQLERAAQEKQGTVFTGRWGRFTDTPQSAYFAGSNPLFADASPLEYLRAYGSHGCMMHPAAWLLPRGVARAAGPWDERLTLNDDGEYFTRVVLHAERIAFCPEAVSYYRSQVSGSLSSQRRRRHLESAHLALDLIVGHMLSHESGDSMRQAAADLCQRFAYDYYPAAPDLVGKALQQAKQLGGSRLRPQGGSAFKILSSLVGWKTARRLQVLAGKFPAPAAD